MQEWIMSPPIWVPALLIAGGLLAALLMRSVAKVPAIALIVAALGLLWFGLDLVTETKREEALRRTSTLINATVDRDWEAFGEAMNPGTRLPGRYNGRVEFVSGAEATIENIGLKTVLITSRSLSQQDSLIDVDATVISTQSATNDQGQKTVWRFRYVETDDGLVLDLIEPLEVGGQDVSVLMNAISKYNALTK